MVRQILTLCMLLGAVTARGADRLEFNRDVRPILSDNCFFCHGPDANDRQAGLRLDIREDAFAQSAFVPGDPENSVLVERVYSADPDLQMPPPDSQRQLTDHQKSILRTWIAEGADYQTHWAFVPPAKADLPSVMEGEFPTDTLPEHPIDRFIQARLAREGLGPSPPASREALIRRVTLDLTGLPPTPDDVETFLQDSSADAYERLVDRLLASPRYGERMAVDWLDVARYADTNGYQVDRDRELWPWRDWVIRAFNRNMPFDQFTIEQLAGDLLPEPSLDQRIATGFHRNHMLNEEGGIIAEEFLAEYTADRVETTAAVWLGQTFNCARCHDHKFDPFTQRDFYALKAFFHNVPERGVGNYSNPIRRNAPPFLLLPTPELESRLAELRARLKTAEQLAAGEKADASEKAHESSEAAEESEGGESKAGESAEVETADDGKRESNKELIETLQKEIAAVELEIPTTLVMEELSEPRTTFVLLRGAYDKPGEPVTADVPAALPRLSDDLPRNRWGLAAWLVSSENPLTARVTVNRFWQHLFGSGLVRSSEDFGSQGDLPSHPELLDWLAMSFQESGWDVKRMLRLIVTSATYRQQSHLPDLLRDRDPENRLLARGPRHRLPAEVIRDQALMASGLLATSIGGPSVKPYHPPGLYEQVTAGSGYNVYVVGQGEELRRRSLYTYWKRSVPHPAMLLFDAPFREICVARRTRSNTALQALNLMNDPTYVEAARFLAQRMIREGGQDVDARITMGMQLLLARTPTTQELAVLRSAFARTRHDFGQDTDAARSLLATGTMGFDETLDLGELAAYTVVAATMLNLDETVTKE